MEAVRALQTPNAEVRGVTAYGKLIELKDNVEKDDHGRGFFGELLLDNGCIWRIRFREDQQAIAAELFRKKVVASGDVKYFRTRTPLMRISKIQMEPPKDYLQAFDRFVGSVPEIKNYGLEKLLQVVREEDN
jgi:hypothetical protein